MQRELEVSSPLEAQRPVVESLEVARVELYGFGEVCNGFFISTEFSAAEASVVVEVVVGWVETDGCGKGLDSPLEQHELILGDAFVVVSEWVGGLGFDGSLVVLHCLLEVAQLVVDEASVEPGLEVARVQLDCLRVELQRLLQLAFFASRQPASVDAASGRGYLSASAASAGLRFGLGSGKRPDRRSDDSAALDSLPVLKEVSVELAGVRSR